MIMLKVNTTTVANVMRLCLQYIIYVAKIQFLINFEQLEKRLTNAFLSTNHTTFN